MEKNGFIATSLIYSFFLVFIAIMAALLTNFIANKTILLRYNDDAIENLNTNTYDVTFVFHGAEAKTSTQRSQAFTNLLSNSNFLDSLEWQSSGTLDFVPTSFTKTTALLTNVSPSSYIYQNVHLVGQQKYYFSIEYSQKDSQPIKTYIEPDYPLVTENTSGVWRRVSRSFLATESTDDKPFVIGNSDMGYREAYFTNAMFINLSEHFGVGNEPTTEWMDENITYFNSTINYLKESKLKGGSELKVTMAGQKRYSKFDTSCTSINGNWVESSENVETSIDVSGDMPIGILNIKNIFDNIKCEVWWKA